MARSMRATSLSLGDLALLMTSEPDRDELFVERWRTTSVFLGERFMMLLIRRTFDAVKARPIHARRKVEAARIRCAFEEAVVCHFFE